MKTLHGSTLEYALYTRSYYHNNHVLFCPSHQLSGHAQGLSDIYDRICSTIQQLQGDKTELQKRVGELEQNNPTADLHRLREENADLRAKLATAAREKTEITRERDVLLRKLNGIKQLIDGPAVPQVYFPPSAQHLTYSIL
jgi:hypothetical protein